MAKKIKLQDRDRDILLHIARHRLTTVRALHALFFPGRKPAAVVSTIRRLRGGGFIQSAKLSADNQLYYFLSRRSAQFLGLPIRLSESLGSQALPIRYAALLLCCCLDQPRRYFSPLEFAAEFPDCVSTLPSEPYYLDIDSDGTPRLGLILVDLGASAARTVKKCKRAIGRRLENPGFRQLIGDDAFLIQLVTVSESKRGAILLAAEKAPFQHRLQVEVITELAGVI